ncbi:MAG TPA: response regulator [Opitutales bacterium]|nr:response regulator [Opitutales bacterium]
MKTSLGKIIAASIGFAGGVLLLMALGSIYSIRQAAASAALVAHTEDVEKQVNGLRASVMDLEAGARNFVITGQESYLNGYADAKLQIPAQAQELQQSVADNPEQAQRARQLAGLLTQRLAFAEQIVDTRRQQGFTAAAAFVQSPAVRQVSGDIRAQIAQMLKVEEALLQERRDQNDWQTTQSIVAAVVTCAIGLGVLAIGTMTIAKQFNDRRFAEEQLARKSAELQGILDNAPHGIFLKDLDSRYLVLNARMKDLLGADPSACLGKTPDELFPAQRAELILAEDRQTLADGQPQQIDLELLCADGALRHFRTHKFVVHDADGRPRALGGIAEDVTAHHEMDVALRQALATAETASRTKSQFLANMSHELRTPLNSIIGFSEILSDKLFGSLNEKQQQYVANILASGRHLLLLINDLLDLAKIESGKMHIEPERVTVTTLLNDGANLVRGTAERKGVKLTVAPADAGLAARLDPARTKQIIYNLLSNAVKFTPKGGQVTLSARGITEPVCPRWGGPPGVVPGTRLPGEWLQVSVTDTGIGIGSEDLQRIFAEFEQVDSTYARQQEGTGLGLTLTSKLANLHGGGVWAESPGRVNQGSTFHVLLPLAGPPAKADAPILPKRPPVVMVTTPSPFQGDSKPGPNGRPLVLVVEDEKSASDLMQEYLVKGGYDVALATTGEEALRLAAQLRPSAITLDIVLPDANGMDVLARLKATHATSHIPVVVVSVTDDRHTGLSLGAAEFFVKPVNAEKLLAALERARAAMHRDIRRVLVVDDEPIARETIQAMLQPRGYKVDAAESGEEALRLIREHPPDVAIVDLTMPGMSGFELVGLLRQNPATRELPICIYTAKDLSASEMHWLHEQSTAVTAKPFREHLLSELRRVCTNSS